MIDLTTLNLNKKTVNFLCKGISFRLQQNFSNITHNLNMSLFCSRLRFFRAIQNSQFSFTSSSLFTYSDPLNKNPPLYLDDKFEHDIKHIENFCTQHHAPEEENNCEENDIIQFLRSQKGVKYVKADKGGCLILLYEDDYEKLVKKHLSDENTYKLVNSHETTFTNEKIKSLTNEYHGCLQSNEIKFLCDFEPKISKFHVLPKLHKCQEIIQICENTCTSYVKIGFCPLDLTSRPIVNNIESSTSHLSHFIDKILSPFMHISSSYIKDSFDFVNQIPRYKLNPTFISLDIQSLYTVIPHDYGLHAIQYWLEKYPEKLDARFSPYFILEALQIILNNNIFQYKQDFYKQINGVAMGTKVAPKYAHLVVAFFEVNLKKDCLENYGETITNQIFHHYFRFLDDIFILTDISDSHITSFISLIQSQHQAFKFSVEISKTTAHFLDVQIHNRHNYIMTDMYHKPTDSFQYVHFSSSHPRHIKRNIPYCLATRIKRIVNTKNARQIRYKELESRLKSLNYPQNLINDAICKAENNSCDKKPTVKKQLIPIKITYNKKSNFIYENALTPKINCIKLNSMITTPVNIVRSYQLGHNLLQSLNQRTRFIVSICGKSRCKTCKILLVNKTSIKINNIEIKFNANMNCTSKNVIYVLFCSGCSCYYVGETNMQLNLRINLHRQHMNNKQYSQQPVSDHFRACGGSFSATPIYQLQGNSRYHLLHLESYFTTLLKPELNSL